MTSRSYSPHGIINPNPDYQICCGLYHATKAAKFFAVYFFILCLIISGANFWAFGADHKWLSILCVLLTIYSLVVLYGMYLEKKAFLIPFLIFHGIMFIALFVFVVVFGAFGAFTDFVEDHHQQNSALRDLYEMHNLNPDDEKIQTTVSSAVLLFFVYNMIVFGYSWYVTWLSFKCFNENDRTMCPGYQKGIVASEEL